jgi:predicted esterase
MFAAKAPGLEGSHITSLHNEMKIGQKPYPGAMRLRFGVTRCLLLALLGCTTMSSPAAAVQTGPLGLQSNVVFTDYSPLSRSMELVRRQLSPLDARRVIHAASQPGKGLREQTIDLSNERFTVYVPLHSHAQSYSLLVFVSPWATAAVPPQWNSSLDHHDMIFVSAVNSGNGANVLDRREPLALLAVQNIVNRYPIDPERVYIGGFSGGSRVALRLALGYPDVFHGALLNAGSDPIGNPHAPLPASPLFSQFQESTQLVYATGEHDDLHLAEDMASRQSLQEWCIFDPVTVTIAWKGHELPDASSFDHALDALVKHETPNANKLAGCRARIDKELNAQLKQAEDLVAGGRLDEARRSLDKIDARYGGLAAPRSVELASRAALD